MFFHSGKNCWLSAVADQGAFLIDGEDYYRAVVEACETAQSVIYILGWDVDSRVRLRREGDGSEETLGKFLDRLARNRPRLHIYILEWDFAVFYSLEREIWSTFSIGWMTHERVHFEMDDNHPVGASHHQKIVAIDDQLAFVGGFDLASFRWDTSEHRAHHPLRQDNGKEYGPVHDVQMLISGELAGKLGELARERWLLATGESLSPPPAADRSAWPMSVDSDFNQLSLAVLRTYPAHAGEPEIREIERFYLDAIEQAESILYLENQYLTSHKVGEALAKSLKREHGPEIVVVLPRQCPGWLEEETMGNLRQRLHQRLQEADRHGRLWVCFPDRSNLDDQIIIVHSKLMIVDDQLLTVGSANLSNRSMSFDTECNLAIAADGDAERAQTIVGLRDRLLAEHLQCQPDDVTEALDRFGSIIAAIQHLNGDRGMLRKLPVESNSTLQQMFPGDLIADPEKPIGLESMLDYFGFGLNSQRIESDATQNGKFWRFAIALVVAMVLAALWRWSPLNQWLSIDHLLEAADYIRSSSMAVLIVLFIYLVGSCLMVPINLLILATALSFGSVTGFMLALTGSTLGGLASYLIGRWLGRDAVQKLAGKKLNRLSRKLAQRGWLPVALIRVVPIAPFTIVNMVAGASHISARSFLLGTTVGMCPGIVAIMIFEEGLERALRGPGWETLGIAALALAGAFLVFYGGLHLLTRQDKKSND